ASDVLPARFFVGIKSDINISSAPWSTQRGRDRPAVDSTLHILYIPKLLLRRDQHNKTLVLYAFPPVSSRRWLGMKLKFICCRHAFIGSGESPNASSSGRCVRRQIRSMPATNSGMLIGLRILPSISDGPRAGMTKAVLWPHFWAIQIILF